MNKAPEPATVGLLGAPGKMSLSQPCDQRLFPRRFAEVIATQRWHSSHQFGFAAPPKVPVQGIFPFLEPLRTWDPFQPCQFDIFPRLRHRGRGGTALAKVQE